MKTKFYKLLLLSVIAAVCGTRTVSAHDGCGFDELQSTMMKNPIYATQVATLENKIYNNTNSNSSRITGNNCQTITGKRIYPVVVHVVWTNPTVGVGDNISDIQITNTIARVNADFANASGLGADANIQLVLAKRAPDGSVTNGIDRVDGRNITNYSQYGVTISQSAIGANNDSVRNTCLWDRTQYINIWVVTKISGSTDGFSIASPYINNEGIIITARNFSSQYTTSTHEIGHFFGLLHTFQGQSTNPYGTCPVNNDCLQDGDKVCDTPPIRSADYTTTPCYSGSDLENSTQNFMSYTAINNRFTAGQVARMLSFQNEEYRLRLLFSKALIPVNTPVEIALSAIENNTAETFCGDGFTPHVSLENIGVNSLASCKVQVYVDGVLKTTTTITAIGLLKGDSRVFDLNPTPITIGTHNIRCVLSEINGSTNDYFSLNNAICGDIYFYKQSYSVDLSSNNGSVSGANSYPCGGKAIISTTALDSNTYEFDSWKNGASVFSIKRIDTIYVTQAYSLEAVYKLRTYNVQAISADTNLGTVSLTGTPNYGQVMTAKAFPKPGQQLKNWKNEQGVIVSTDSVYKFSVLGDGKVTATFVSATVTAIQQHAFENLNLYPNPAQDWVTLKGFQNKNITVYDLIGNIISQQEIINEQIDISILPAGIYMLRSENTEKTYIGKLIKQ